MTISAGVDSNQPNVDEPDQSEWRVLDLIDRLQDGSLAWVELTESQRQRVVQATGLPLDQWDTGV